jgi:L-lactate dehydrogenase complex protein LldF
MRVFGAVVSRPRLFEMLGALTRVMMRVLPRSVMRKASGPWGRAREVPVAPQQSFRDWYRRRS